MYAVSSAAASPLHGTHHDAQKLSTTGFPRNAARSTTPLPSMRFSENAGAGPPIFGGCDWCVSRQTSRPSSPATAKRAITWPESLSVRPMATGATMKTGVPTVTWSNSHSACGISMRMQPCDSE